MSIGRLADGNRRVFVVYGMPRCGTTYLYRALSQHPSIYVAYRKESHYFSVNYHKGHDWFNALYDGMGDDQLGADINPMYYLDDRALPRLLAYDKNVKVILGVRHPVDFAVSLYGNMRAHGQEVGPIGTMVKHFDWPLAPHESVSFRLGDGFMRARVSELAETLQDNLLVYDFSAFNQAALPVLQEMERFLDLPPFFDEGNYETARINASGRRDPLLLNRLLKYQRLLEFVYKILPRSAIHTLRNAFEKLSVRTSDSSGTKSELVSETELASLAEYLADDIAWYDALFAADPILRGSDIAGSAATILATRDNRHNGSL